MGRSHARVTLPPGVRKVMGSNPIGTQIFSRIHARVTLLSYSGTCRSNSPQISRLLVIFQNRDLIIAWIIRKFMQLVNFVTFSVFYFFFGNRVWLNLYERTLPGNEISIITSSFDLWKRQCENLFNVEPFFVFYAESVMLGPRFIPESVLYTQSVMLRPRFIPESVFYTQSVVRSP